MDNTIGLPTIKYIWDNLYCAVFEMETHKDDASVSVICEKMSMRKDQSIMNLLVGIKVYI